MLIVFLFLNLWFSSPIMKQFVKNKIANTVVNLTKKFFVPLLPKKVCEGLLNEAPA